MVTKLELINKVRSSDNKTALQAIEEMRIRGWLTDGTLRGIALIRAQLQGADLIEADLSFIDLQHAEMEYVDLSNANLNGTVLTRANLIGANLNETNLTNANLYKTNLRGCRNLTVEQLSKVKRLWGAIMPDGESYDGRYNLPVDLKFAHMNGTV